MIQGSWPSRAPSVCSSPSSVGTIPSPELRAEGPGVQARPHTGSRLDHSRRREPEIVSRHARIVGYPRWLPEAPTYLFPQGLGSASEAHCPLRLGPGGNVPEPRFVGSERQCVSESTLSK
jgi:hypothetical protein